MVCLGTFGAVVSLIISSLHLPARLPRYRITGRYVDIQHPIRGVGTGGDSGVNIRTRISGLSMGNKSLRSLRNQHTRSAACFDLSICSWNATQTADGGLSEKNSSTFYGTVGIFRVPRSSSQFLAIIKDAVPAEHIGEGVFKVKEIGLIRIPRASVHTTEPRTGPESENASDVKLSDEERDAFEMLRRTFARHSFYFSSGAYDVSRTLQSNVLRARVRAVNASAAARSLDCDPRFFWNHDVARPLIDAGCKDLVTPIINMWTQSFVVGGHRDRTKMASLRKQCILTLIARRSRFRQGPRYSIKINIYESDDALCFTITRYFHTGTPNEGSTSSATWQTSWSPSKFYVGLEAMRRALSYRCRDIAWMGACLLVILSYVD
jgi:hypothetical protein